MATTPTLPSGWKSGPTYRNDSTKKDYIYTGPDGSRIIVTTKSNTIVSTKAYDSKNNPLYSQQGTGPVMSTSSQVTSSVQSLTQSLQTSLSAGAVQPLAGSPPITVNPGAATANPFAILDPSNIIKNITGITTDFGAGDKEKKSVLVYPIDAIYTKNKTTNPKTSQDYLKINKYSYKPPYQNALFGQGANPLKTGLTRESPIKEQLGMVLLPMPNSVTDSNNVAWAEDNMNALSAAALNKVVTDPGSLGIGAGLGGLLGLLGGLSGALQGAQKGAAAALYYKLIEEALNGGKNPQTIGTAAATSKILSMAGFSVSPESILARGAGVIPNSNLELLFNAPTIREFTFQYRLSPREKKEADEIKRIIKFFKRGMAPKKQNSTSGNTGASSYFLGTPNIFDLSYSTSGDKEIEGVNKIKTCALTGFSVNYTADGGWAAYDEGQPVAYIMNMSFKELEPVYDIDYNKDDNTIGY